MVIEWRRSGLDSKDWEDTVASARGGTIFHSSPWLKLAARAWGYEAAHLIGYELDQPVAVIPALLAEGSLQSLPVIDYGGCAYSADADPTLIEKGVESAFRVFAQLWRGKASALYVRPHFSNLLHNRVNQRLGAPVANYVTFVLKDFAEDDVLTLFHKKTRSAVRSAMRSGATFHWLDVSDVNDCRMYEAHHRKSKAAHHSDPFPSGFFLGLKELPPPMTRMGVVRLGEEVEAGVLTLEDSSTAYLIDSWSIREGVPNAAEFAYYHMILHAQGRLAVVDLGRTSADARGLLRFKERFGGVANSLSTYRLPLSGRIKSYLDLAKRRAYASIVGLSGEGEDRTGLPPHRQMPVDPEGGKSH